MTLNQLRYFCAAAQCGTFSRAAEQIHISQPSLCVAIRNLEKELGVALFRTNCRGAVLTDAGRLLLQDAQGILQQVDAAAAHMRQYAQRTGAEIRLAYTAAVARNIPRLLRDFAADGGAGCCICSDEMPSDQIACGLREGRFDLGICSRLPPEPELEQTPVLFQRLCLLLPAGFPAAALSTSARALDGVPLICYRQDYPMYRLLCDLFDRWGVAPRIIHYAYSEDSIAQLVAQEMGAAIVAQTEGLEMYGVQLLHPAWLTGGRSVYLTRHRTRPLAEPARLLAAHILAQADPQAGA